MSTLRRFGQPVVLAALTCCAAPTLARGQESAAPKPSFFEAQGNAQSRLQASLAELAALREAIVAERVPLGEELSALERSLSDARREYQGVKRTLDGETLGLSNLEAELESRRRESSYLSNLFTEYIRNFESRLHIAEVQRYSAPLEAAKLAPESSDRSTLEVFQAQVAVLTTSLDRIDEAFGGASFTGRAVDSGGIVNQGTFVLVGPTAVFRSNSGQVVGAAEQRLSNEPIIVDYGDPEDASAAATLIADGAGFLPFDATLGNAHKMESTRETFVEHIRKGGPVMVPIFAMAAAALLVALLKWVSLTLVRKPSRKAIGALLSAIDQQDEDAALKHGSALSERGPVGRMLWDGVQHMHEPRELVEEVMYETVLTTKHRVQSFLPFVAICAASAPLLGLLGTVTGIINTFKLITVFGSGDVKSLSGGISEALITTKWGLIVAIPSLLLHAFLARKARSIVAKMEGTAVAFVNRLTKSEALAQDAATVRETARETSAPEAELVRSQVTRILGELLGPLHDARGKGAQAHTARQDV